MMMDGSNNSKRPPLPPKPNWRTATDESSAIRKSNSILRAEFFATPDSLLNPELSQSRTLTRGVDVAGKVCKFDQIARGRDDRGPGAAGQLLRRTRSPSTKSTGHSPVERGAGMVRSKSSSEFASLVRVSASEIGSPQKAVLVTRKARPAAEEQTSLLPDRARIQVAAEVVVHERLGRDPPDKKVSEENDHGEQWKVR
jgi:hypothetical protein